MGYNVVWPRLSYMCKYTWKLTHSARAYDDSLARLYYMYSISTTLRLSSSLIVFYNYIDSFIIFFDGLEGHL